MRSAARMESRNALDTSAAWIKQFAASDDVLLERLRRHDETAFEDLFLRYYPQVYRVLFGVVGNAQEAEDLVQETFIVLYRRPPRLPNATALGPWLYRVAVNRGYNALRGARRARLRVEQLPIDAAQPDDPAAEYLRREERARVRLTLARLAERDAKLLLLRYAGLSYAEIAAAMEVAAGSVGTLLVRAERAFTKAYGHATAEHET